MTMTGEESAVDPCPTIPETFVNPLRILKQARAQEGLHAGCGCRGRPGGDRGRKPAGRPGVHPTSGASPVDGGHATRERIVGRDPGCGGVCAGVLRARRKAFLGDGAENNWTVRKRWFSDFVAILDFIHALSYVFAVAMAGRGFATGWEVYVRWIRWVWQGRVAAVIQELEQRQKELGLPGAEDSESSPRRVVAEGLRYLKNHQDQMRYDEYRRQGLPITSSHVESTVKQFNRRVKGTEKFWSEEGAEAILQLRADYLSETEPMETFWQEREARATGRRCYRRAV